MAFNINNLPVGWSAGRVGQNRVFRTPDGRQIDPKEAAGILRNMGEEEGSTTASGSFSGFGSSDDDVIVNDPLSASSGMTIKRPTMDQPIVDDPDLNMRNGASDGAGQPDGVAPYVEEGIGDTGNAVAPSLSDLPSNDLSTEVPGFEDSAVIETKEDDVALEVTRPMGETGFTNSDGSQITNQSDIDGIQAILQADGSLTKEQAVRIYNYNQENVGPTGKTESLLPSIDADKVTNAGEEELSLSAGSTQGGGYSLPPTAGKMTTYKPDGTFTYNDIELFDYKTASDLLKGVSKGSPIGDVLAHYDSILSKGEPEIQGFDIEDTDPNSPTFGDIITADVVLGEDIVGTQGWGYYTTEAVEQQVIGADGVEKLNEDGTPLMETVHTEIFKIDANSLKAGMAYERSIDIFDNMQNFVQNSALATDASSRDLLVRQAMAFTEDQYALNRQSIAHFNALDAIAAQGGIAADLQKASQDFQQNQRLLKERFDKAESDLGRKFTTSERLAIEAWQEEQRTGVGGTQAFTTAEREAIQTWQETQRTGEGGTQEFSTSEREASQAESERVRLLEADIRELEISEGRTFTTDERKAIQAFQVSREEISRSEKLDDQSTGQKFAISEREAQELFASKQADINRGATRDESKLSREAASNRQEDAQEFAFSERVSNQEFSNAQSQLGREFSVTERQAIQDFQKSQATINRGFSAEQSTLDREAASARQEDTQAFESEQSRLSETFQIRRDSLKFDMDSRMESARLGIADATSEAGIQEAVKLAQEARDLERTMAAVDIVERIALNPAMKRSLEESGVLAALEAEFGLDLSFIMGGGLSTGGGGGAPVRVTA
tara:strand:- start:324 stop:2840 length:2517 start_codon:yes stop_codon:yes gene_type:complete